MNAEWDTNSLGRPSSRRRFLQGLAAGGVLTGLNAWPWPRAAAAGAPHGAALSGTRFDLTIGPEMVDFTGTPALATLVNGVLPAPVLRWREGDTVTLNVRNELSEPASIHWHGILVPGNMDGVPGLSYRGIYPGESYTYRFEVRQSGTYWYHSHSHFQEQTGVHGPLVIDPREPEPFGYDREHVVLLSDWTDRDPDSLYALLKKQSDFFNYNRRTLGDFIQDAGRGGFGPALKNRFAWARMRMMPSDLADVSGYGYTFLMNGTAPAGNWTGLFRPGERLRLRFINGSAMSYFDVRIPGLKMTVVAADGQYVHPVTVDEFRIGVAEVLDVLVEPAGADAFTIFAQSMDRSGYARGTLATRDGLSAPVPEPDKVVRLTMADVGMGAMGGGGSMGAMGHAAMAHETPADAGEHGGHGAAMPASAEGSMAMLEHPATERHNPGVAMQSMTVTARLDDPGVGLRDNGRRTLTYADLVSVFPDPDGREPGRTIHLHLTGHMERYIWSFNGVQFSQSEPIDLRYGERVRLVLANDTMMEHPIHLHGLWSDLEDESGAFLVRKHTISIPPGTQRSYRVRADALGRWAYHCHLLYHMEAGMFREVRVGKELT
jgi:CopA family copper-resistance protein